MSYEVTFSAAASRQIKKLPPDLRINLIALAETLAANSRPSGVVKLEGDDNAYRIRFRDYRIVYEIYDDKLIVVVIKVGASSRCLSIANKVFSRLIDSA